MHPSRDSKILRTTLILFFLSAIAYGGYAAHGVILGPTVTVPASTFSTSSPFAVIEGVTERISELRLNGTRITVTESGAFHEPFLLAPGTNHFLLEARDSRGRTATERVTVLYVPEEDTAPLFAPPSATSTATSTEPAGVHGSTTPAAPAPTQSATGTRE